MTTYIQPKKGQLYIHILDRTPWLVRVTQVEPKMQRNAGSDWHGVLVGEQQGIPDGSPCWGHAYELRTNSPVGE